MSQVKNDRALRFYKDVLGLEKLHYGIWLADDELSFDNLKTAQQRYEDLLVGSIPDGVKQVLDVGCGTGAMSLRLKNLGYDVEGLSPDINQKDVFAAKVDAPFHFCCFEDFKPEHQYDCIIMSESCQYIPLPNLFEVCDLALKPGGYLMICDYFILENASGIFSKSGHPYQHFMQEAEKRGFRLIRNEDITQKITKTLDIAKDLLNRVLTGLDIATEKFRLGNPRLSRFFAWLFKKRVQRFSAQSALLDSEEFIANKTYRFLLFQWKTDSSTK